MKGFFTAVSSYFNVFPVVHKHKLWSFYYLPFIFNLVLFFLYGWMISLMMEPIMNYIKDFLNFDLGSIVDGIIDLFIWVVTFFTKKIIVLHTFQYASLIFLPPLYSLISEALLNKMTGNERPFNFKLLINDIVRGVRIAVRNVVLQLLITIPLILLSFFFPPLSILVFFISSYFYGAAMMDYRNEYYNYKVKDSLRLIRENRGFAIGIGVCYNFFFLCWSFIGLDFIGFMYVPVLSIVAAIIGMEKLKMKVKKI